LHSTQRFEIEELLRQMYRAHHFLGGFQTRKLSRHGNRRGEGNAEATATSNFTHWTSAEKEARMEHDIQETKCTGGRKEGERFGLKRDEHTQYTSLSLSLSLHHLSQRCGATLNMRQVKLLNRDGKCAKGAQCKPRKSSLLSPSVLN
jgi:hypothetical protein